MTHHTGIFYAENSVRKIQSERLLCRLSRSSIGDPMTRALILWFLVHSNALDECTGLPCPVALSVCGRSAQDTVTSSIVEFLETAAKCDNDNNINLAIKQIGKPLLLTVEQTLCLPDGEFFHPGVNRSWNEISAVTIVIALRNARACFYGEKRATKIRVLSRPRDADLTAILTKYQDLVM